MSRDATGFALSVLNQFAGSSLADKFGLRKLIETISYSSTKKGFQAVSLASRQFKVVNKLLNPARLTAPKQANNLFDLNISDEQKMIRENVQRFSTEVIRPLSVEANDACKTAQDIFIQAQSLGLIYCSIPESLGGAAAQRSQMTNALITEDLAYGDMGTAISLMAPIGVASAISQWGTAEQQGKYLPTFLDDDSPVASIAVNEPTPLFDPYDLKTTAKVIGNSYVLNGVKSLVPVGLNSEIYLVAAKVIEDNQETEQAVFIVESSALGMTVKEHNSMGIRASSLARLKLDNVEVNKAQRLGLDKEFSYQAFVDNSRLGWCSLAIGTCQAILDYVIPYCNERVAFGEPISQRQSVAFMISDMKIDLESMRMLTLRAVSRAENGLNFQKEAFLAKVMCAEKAMNIATNGVQLLGGHGFTKEHPVERWYRDLRVIGLAEGGIHL